jgi:hypothetical protein
MRLPTLLLLSAVLPAQGLATRVTTAAAWTARTESDTRSLPSSTDVTGGTRLHATSTNQYSTVEVALQREVHRHVVRFTQATQNWRTTYNSVNTETAGGVRVVFSSPRAFRARLSVQLDPTTSVQSLYSWARSAVQADVAGAGVVTGATTGPVARAFDVTVDAAGVAVVIDGWARARSEMSTMTATLGATLVLEPDPRERFTVTAFGSACGAQLGAGPDVGEPGALRFALAGGSNPGQAWLAFGGQRLDLPLPGPCRLLAEPLVVVPVALQNGAGVLWLTPPASQGLRFTAQGLTFAGGELRASQGLELAR